MQLTYRLLPPIKAAQQRLQRGDHTYVGQPGQAVDHDASAAALLASNGWLRICASGTTAERPVAGSDGTAHFGGPLMAPGFLYLDRTLGYVIVWDGATWRDPNTGDAV